MSEDKQRYDEEWLQDVKPESVRKAVDAGEILPQLPLPDIREGKTNSEETLLVKFLALPKKVPNRDFLTAEVEHQGVRKSMICPSSLRFNLKKECELKGLDNPAGHSFIIGAHVQETKYSKDTKLYWVQYHAPGEGSQSAAGADSDQDKSPSDGKE